MCIESKFSFVCDSIILFQGFDIFQNVKCRLYECCSEPYLRNNFSALENNLNKYLFGQPLVKNTIVNALKGHFNLNGQKKALVMSFHGSTGVGKSTTSLTASCDY